jgi:hypothetical protein
MNTAGFTTPSLVTLAQYHPQVALAVANGVPLRPNLRPLSVELQNSQLGNPQPASFQEVIGMYSIFAGVKITIDPTGNLAGNPMKYLADAAQPLTSGITVSMLVKSRDGVDYAPIPDETPLQAVPISFAPAVGIWRMVNPENIKVKFTLQSVAEGDPFTVWMVFCFLVLASSGAPYLDMKPEDARAALRQMGIWPLTAAA